MHASPAWPSHTCLAVEGGTRTREQPGQTAKEISTDGRVRGYSGAQYMLVMPQHAAEVGTGEFAGGGSSAFDRRDHRNPF
jgi:hypothetical protein